MGRRFAEAIWPATTAIHTRLMIPNEGDAISAQQRRARHQARSWLPLQRADRQNRARDNSAPVGCGATPDGRPSTG
jgi:hypothetical protein